MHRIHAIGCMTSPMGAHQHPAYGIDPSLRLGHRQRGPRPARGQRAHLGPLARVRPVSTRSALAPQVPQPQLPGAIPPGAVPGRDERGHSPLSALTGAEPCERTNATKNAPEPAGAQKPSLNPAENARSDLLLPEPHALKPGIGLLEAPAVISLEHVGDGEHQIKRAADIAAAADRAALQGVGELEEFQLRQPVALFKGSKGVVLLVRHAAET